MSQKKTYVISYRFINSPHTKWIQQIITEKQTKKDLKATLHRIVRIL